MKINLQNFLIVVLILLGPICGLASTTPPSPRRPPPPPPGDRVPIDENLMVLLIVALLFGIYIIYKHRLKQKTPA